MDWPDPEGRISEGLDKNVHLGKPSWIFWRDIVQKGGGVPLY